MKKNRPDRFLYQSGQSSTAETNYIRYKEDAIEAISAGAVSSMDF
jgi:hypothetical protein